MSSRWITRDK